METVNIHEAETHFSRLLARVHTGEEIIIAKAGTPYAKLVPLKQISKRIPGIAKGAATDLVSTCKESTLPNLKDFRASIRFSGDSLSKSVLKNREEERY